MPGCASFDDGIHFANHSVLKLDISSVFMVVWITVATGWESMNPWLTVYSRSPIALTVVDMYKMPWLINFQILLFMEGHPSNYHSTIDDAKWIFHDFKKKILKFDFYPGQNLWRDNLTSFWLLRRKKLTLNFSINLWRGDLTSFGQFWIFK